jgi:hypothetical protein
VAYYDQRPPNDEPRPGCLDALVITRAVFAVLFWPIAALFAVMIDAGLIFYLFTTWAPLALIPIAITAFAVHVFARWDQRRHRPPGL